MERHLKRLLRMRWLFVAMLVVPAATEGQALSLHDAINATLANYPLLQQRQAEVAAGQAHVNTINGNRLPSLLLQDQLNMGTNNALQGPYFSLGIVPSTSGGNSANPVRMNPTTGNIAISFLQWEFYNFGYYRAQQRNAQAQLEVNKANLGSDKYQLTENVISLYLDWLKKYRLVQIQDENMRRAEVILTAIRANVLSGLKPGVDSSMAMAAYADARIAWLQAKDQYNYDRIALGSYTGMGMDNTLPDTGSVAPSFLLGQMHLPATDSVPNGHPLLNVYEKQYEQQVADNRTIAKQYLPKLGLDAATWARNSGISYSGAYPESLSDGFPYSKYNYLLGVTVSYNLFNLKHMHDQLAEGKYMAESKQDAVRTEHLTLNKMMQQANSAYETTIEKLREIPAQLQSAQMAYNQQVALYKSGLNTLTEVTNAQYFLLQAETSYVIAQDELLQLLYIRAGLSGQIDTFLQNAK